MAAGEGELLDLGGGKGMYTSDHSIVCRNHCRNQARDHGESMYLLGELGLETQDLYRYPKIEY